MRPERSDKNGARNAERRSPAARAAAGAMTSRSMRPRARASASVTRIASVRTASKPRPFADRTATVKWRHTDQSGVGRSMGAGSSTISSGVRRTKRDQFALRLRSDINTILNQLLKGDHLNDRRSATRSRQRVACTVLVTVKTPRTTFVPAFKTLSVSVIVIVAALPLTVPEIASLVSATSRTPLP